MIFYRSIILFAVLQFCYFCSKSQDNNYVYRDSAILYEDSVAEAATAISKEDTIFEETQENEEYTADTILMNNQLFIESDSIRVLKNSKPFAYAKSLDSLLFKYQQSMKKEDISARNEISWLARFFLSPFTKYFFWMLAAIFVSFILYKLFFSEGFFQQPYAKINVTVLPDEKENLPMNADYEKLISQAVVSRNYRAAVRYHYLQSLQKLSLKGVIQYATDKTNYQYVRELSGKTYKNSFASLTLNYEYVWYGEFEVDENVFHTLEYKFKRFNSQV